MTVPRDPPLLPLLRGIGLSTIYSLRVFVTLCFDNGGSSQERRLARFNRANPTPSQLSSPEREFHELWGPGLRICGGFSIESDSLADRTFATTGTLGDQCQPEVDPAARVEGEDEAQARVPESPGFR